VAEIVQGGFYFHPGVKKPLDCIELPYMNSESAVRRRASRTGSLPPDLVLVFTEALRAFPYLLIWNAFIPHPRQRQLGAGHRRTDDAPCGEAQPQTGGLAQEFSVPGSELEDSEASRGANI
jgi:hypothetical protein